MTIESDGAPRAGVPDRQHERGLDLFYVGVLVVAGREHTRTMNLVTAFGSGAAFLGAAVAVVGLVVNASNNRRAQYDRILSETAKLSQGSVADARHGAGMLLERGPKDNVLSDDVVNQVLDVLWAFERLAGLYESLRPRWLRSRRPNAPQRLLLMSCRGAISTWHGYSTTGFKTVSGEPISFVPSNIGVRNLYEELKKL